MRDSLILAATICAIASPAIAAPGGALRTLLRGNYECGTPGLAGETPAYVMEDKAFEVINASSYMQDGKRGTYLHTGDRIVFTSGKMRGARFERISEGMLREELADGSLGDIRCVKR